MSSEQVNELKNRGNAALAAGNNEEAVKSYTEAIELDATNYVLFSNRSATYATMNKGELALADAEKCIELNPTFVKGYSRKGAALRLLDRTEEACEAYEEGLKIDPDNALLRKEINEAKTGSHRGPFGANSLFNSQMFGNLLNNPRAQELLNDPDTCRAFIDMQNGKFDGTALNNPKILELMSLAIGRSSPSTTPPSPPSSPVNNTKTKSYAEATSKPEPPKVPLSQAEIEKEEGNSHYRKKEFEQALEHYDKAIELDSTKMSYLLNKAAVFYEMHDYDKCREICEKAVDVGRENKASFTDVAKAMARVGNSYFQEENYEMAIKYYLHSLAEYRNPEIVKKKDLAVKLQAELEQKKMLDPVKAESEKNKGNNYFQNGDYPKAVHHYSEAIKRNPNDARYYSNRAACYTKLMEFELALRDCDECIKRDPKFIKAFLRKGAALSAMQQHSRAADAYAKALEIDPSCKEAWDGRKLSLSKSDSDPEEVTKRAMGDPEIKEILSDPAMRMILAQMQEDPSAFQEHMRNEQIRDKLMKLIEAGVIGVRHA